MKTVIHRLVHIDVAEAMEFYEREGGSHLAADFFYEYERVLDSIRERPHSFAITRGVARRANFERFPFHASFIILTDFVLVLVIRHDARHQDFGLDR